jgi:hypothetical protein
MKKNITDLITEFKSLEGQELLAEYNQLIKLCDTLLTDFPDQLGTEPYYSLTLDVIDRAFSLRLAFGSNKFYDGGDFDYELRSRSWHLLLKVVPADEKMQNAVTRFFKG